MAWSQISGGTSESISMLAVPPYTAAVRSATSFILRTSSSRACFSLVRIVPSNTAVWGMMLAAVPA